MPRRDRMLLMFQTFRCQTHQQCMTSPLRDARLVEDAASGASVQSLPLGNANVLPAVCAEYDSPTVKHVSSSGIAKPTITTYMHTVAMVVLGMIMNCTKLPACVYPDHLRHLPPIVRLGVAMSCTAGASGNRTSETLGRPVPAYHRLG